MKTLLLLIPVVALTACTNMPQIVKALGNDHAVVAIQVRSIYGTLYFTRDGRTNASTKVTPEGSIESALVGGAK